MSTRDLGKLFLAVSGMTFVTVLARLAWAAGSYQIGFYLPGIWKMWGGWILLWLLITVVGLVLFLVKRP